MLEFNHDELEFEKLSAEHDLSDFECEISDLNQFLAEEALQQMTGKINVTYLASINSNFIGYFTISTDAIKTTNISSEDKELLARKGIPYSSLPALKLCRLAVDRRYKGNGIGTYLVEKLIRQAIDLSENVGLRYITVDAYIKTHEFYTKNSNLEFIVWPNMDYKIKRWNESKEKDETETVPLYMDIHETP